NELKEEIKNLDYENDYMSSNEHPNYDVFLENRRRKIFQIKLSGIIRLENGDYRFYYYDDYELCEKFLSYDFVLINKKSGKLFYFDFKNNDNVLYNDKYCQILFQINRYKNTLSATIQKIKCL